MWAFSSNPREKAIYIGETVANIKVRFRMAIRIYSFCSSSVISVILSGYTTDIVLDLLVEVKIL